MFLRVGTGLRGSAPACSVLEPAPPPLKQGGSYPSWGLRPRTASRPQKPSFPTAGVGEGRRGGSGSPAGGHGNRSAAAARSCFCVGVLSLERASPRLRGFSTELPQKQTWVSESPLYSQSVNHWSVPAIMSLTCFVAQITREICIHYIY